MIPKPPKTLLTEGGELKPHPTCVDKDIRCPECRELLVRAETGWTCPLGLAAGHMGLLSDELMLARISEAVRHHNYGRRKRPCKQLDSGKIFRWLRRRGRWLTAIRAAGEAPAATPATPPPAERPACRKCRERDKVVLPSDPEPAKKVFSVPYCARCQLTLTTAGHPDVRHLLPPHDFD